MGEIAEMMLDGTCCQSCGEYLGGDGDGFPVSCPSCERDKEPRKTPAKLASRKRSRNRTKSKGGRS